MTTTEIRPPVPPFTVETARQKVRMAEDAWNTRDHKRAGRAFLRPAHTVAGGVVFGRPYAAPFSVR